MGLLLDSLRSVDFLSGETEDTVAAFMMLGKSVDCPRGHVFWRAGRPPEWLVVPVSGEAKSSARNPEGREFIDDLYGAGQCVGLPSALDGFVQPTDAEVVRSGEFFMIPRVSFVTFLEEHPVVRAGALAVIDANYRRGLREREDSALRSVPERLADFLRRHACQRQSDGARVLLRGTQAELAARLGTVREIVARVLANLEQRGIIERRDNVIFVSNWEALLVEAGFDPAREEATAFLGTPQARSERRTARFFLPTIERMRRREGPDEAATCRSYLGDLSRCRDIHCPVASEADKRRVTS